MTRSTIDIERLARCYAIVRDALLAERGEHGHWEGELSTSALSTATAVMALEMVRRDRERRRLPAISSDILLIRGGLDWLAAHQNPDGGWGDTVKSVSNISTSMLAHAAFHAAAPATNASPYQTIVAAAAEYIERIGGVDAVLRRYGKDRTFSIPILTHCALAGLVDWKDVLPLPFELACIPPQFYKTVRLPVVSYALPALIAIGQVRHFHRKPWNPLSRGVRAIAIGPSLRRLEQIQPSNGGFLEAAPLTSFVTMSLAGMNLSDHPVAVKGAGFLRESVRADGSWPIDTNLATWVTTLSVNALKDNLPRDAAESIVSWLLGQQYRERHPYTNADPGGWAWTDLPGGVPDADDTPGAILALLRLRRGQPLSMGEREALAAAVKWLLDLQNRDGGWPTFCRGWGALPFDRSAPDLTAHALRAVAEWESRIQREAKPSTTSETQLRARTAAAIRRGFAYLMRSQRADGSWLPLWFGNQFAPDDINPVYGTSRVLAAYRDGWRMHAPEADRGWQFLAAQQNTDGGWGGMNGVPSSIEESALAVEMGVSFAPQSETVRRGLDYLLVRIEQGTFAETCPIGFYFAKLWYFERLYPTAFMVSAIGRAVDLAAGPMAEEAARRAAIR